MFLHNRGAILVFILVLLVHLEATEYQEKFKDPHNHKDLPKVNRNTISAGENVRLKNIRNSNIEKLIAGSAKAIRPKPPARDNRPNGLSPSKENNRPRGSNRSLHTSINKSISKGNVTSNKYEKKKQSKVLNIRKSQQLNMNNRKTKISSTGGCSSGVKGNKKGDACHNSGDKFKRCINIPGAEVIEQWNKTFVIPIPSWFWPGFWSFFG